MLPAERKRAIEKEVNSKGSVLVKDLSRIFDVTEETVRRDLDRLEAEGKLRRSHGGAVRVDDGPGEIPYLEREKAYVFEKLSIAHVAVQHIQSGDRVVLDASTTAWYVAKELPDIPLTVLTNSLKVAMELANRDKIEVFSIGGILRPSSLSFVGPLAEQNLEQFHVNKAFISCKGIHTEYGISESHAFQALVKRKMIEIADMVFVLADHSKVQIRDFTLAASLDEIDVLITDRETEESFIERIRDHGIRIISV